MPRHEAPGPSAAPSTRERILDIALTLFTERGYDKTSIRDIAERLGTTKAALYYHFKSKADILLELHLRLHALGDQQLSKLEALPDAGARRRALPELLDEYITLVDRNRDLVRLAERNQSAFDALGDSERHRAANDELGRRLRRLLEDSDLSAATRVRIACCVGAVQDGLLAETLVGDVPHDERVALVRSIVGRLSRED